MQAFNERSKAMRFTAIAVGMSFLSMLFVLISLVSGGRTPGVAPKSAATLPQPYELPARVALHDPRFIIWTPLCFIDYVLYIFRGYNQ